MDGSQEHELEEWTTVRTTRPRVPGHSETVHQATGLLDPPPSYQSGSRHYRVNHNTAFATSQARSVETMLSIRVQPNQKRSWQYIFCWALWLMVVVLIVLCTIAIVLSAEPVADSGSGYTIPPRASRRADLRSSSTEILAVSGLYMIPPTTKDADWVQADRSRFEPAVSTTISPEDIIGSLVRIEGTSTVAIRNGWRDPEQTASEEDVTFNRWGVETLYRLRRRAVSAVQIQRGWCMNNVCSDERVLSTMCRKKHKDMGRFERQECDWCWNEKQRAERTLMQNDKIAKHCETVAHQAARFLIFICGSLFLLSLAVPVILVFRLWSRKKARTDIKNAQGEPNRSNRYGGFWPFWLGSNLVKRFESAASLKEERIRVPWYQSVFRKPNDTLGTNGKENRSRTRLQKKLGDNCPLDGPNNKKSKAPIMPAATDSWVFANLDNMGERTSPGLGEPNGQRGRRRSSRRSEAVSSDSEHISTAQGSSVGEHGLTNDERGQLPRPDL
jgi:hypothetical protein